MDPHHRIETRDGMTIEWDAPVAMDDGVVLRCDVYRPLGGGRHPVILSYGPYAKGLAFQEGYKSAWTRLTRDHPEVLEGSSNIYQNWELVDPEKWVPDGYVCVRVDSRGAGRSPGYLDVWSAREARDLHDCIEWAGTRDWSSGRVGLDGISYYAMNQWQVACLQPPHLTAMCAWEGASDYYRELARHGGILSDFLGNWYARQVVSVQHGVGDRGSRSPVTGEPVAGPDNLSADQLAANRAESGAEVLSRPLIDDDYRARMPDFSRITVPFLSAANWGGQGLHSRGNFEGFTRAASPRKWLEVHGSSHFHHFYSNYGDGLQRRFFAHFLKGEANGWESQPPVQINVRHSGEKFVVRAEQEWPLARTQWTRYYLGSEGHTLSRAEPMADAKIDYDTTGDGLTFMTEPLASPVEITGPVAMKICLSSHTTDADVFAVLRLFAPDGREVVFVGANDPRMPIGMGWLRASHRKLDTDESTPWRPVHAHDELQPLHPGEPVDLDVEIWPTSIVAPAGYRLAVSIRGRDYEYDGSDAALPHAPYQMKGTGPFTHTNPSDRPERIFETTNTLHFERGRMPYVLLPIIPD